MRRLSFALIAVLILAAIGCAFAVSGHIDHSVPTISAAAQPLAASDTVYITDTGAKYHRSKCRYLKHSKTAIKRSEAIAQGYKACKVCKP